MKVQIGATSPRLPGVAITGEIKVGDEVILMPMGLKDGQRVRGKLSPAKSLPAQEPMSSTMKM